MKRKKYIIFIRVFRCQGNYFLCIFKFIGLYFKYILLSETILPHIVVGILFARLPDNIEWLSLFISIVTLGIVGVYLISRAIIYLSC